MAAVAEALLRLLPSGTETVHVLASAADLKPDRTAVLDPSDTIVAIASHPGPAARGIIRLSGPLALAIALEEFEADDPTPIPSKPTVYEGRYNVVGLPARVVLWPGPRSYTGQAVAEIHTIGSMPILRHLVNLCLTRGARMAEPGEFTLRAFLSGRIDLSQSEAVLAVIEARTPVQLDAALRGLAGGLAAPVRALRERLLDRLVDLEANLDFVEESDVTPVARAALCDDLTDALRCLEDLTSRFQSRERSDARPRVVLAGPPNSGKSRLFNALLGEDRAIVAPTAGTTRDDLVAPCDCDGVMVDLIDTAGEESADSNISEAAQSRRAARVAEADLVLLCVPAAAMAESTPHPYPPPQGGREFEPPPLPERSSEWSPPPLRGRVRVGGESQDQARTLVVSTMADLRINPSPLVWEGRESKSDPLLTSARTGQGLDDLRRAIASRLRLQSAETDTHTLGSRFREGLDRATESIQTALTIASGSGGEELIAAELHRAIDDLGALVGAVVTEDILDRIFRRFCVGK
jgi:tRNA modification GTPase